LAFTEGLFLFLKKRRIFKSFAVLKYYIVEKWKKALNFYSKISYESADHITTLCPSNVEKLVRDGAPRKKIEIIPGGISLDGKEELYEHEKLSNPKSFTVGMLGNVQPVKRVELFIRVAKYLKEKYDMVNWDFHVMGRDDPNVQEYVDMGLSYLMIRFGDFPDLDGMRLFQKEVAPKIKP